MARRSLAGAGALAAVLLLAAGFARVALPAEPGGTSSRGLYRVQAAPQLEPLVINRMHAWVLRLETADGRPVENADVTVDGGMPDHDHGLPTAPRVTGETEPGLYLVEGLRFHMNGAWELTVTIDAAQGRDTAVLRFAL